jgi:hypothetical protein
MKFSYKHKHLLPDLYKIQCNICVQYIILLVVCGFCNIDQRNALLSNLTDVVNFLYAGAYYFWVLGVEFASYHSSDV